MANKEAEKKDVTGLDQVSNRKEAEYDLVKALLESAEYKTAEDSITEAEIRRNGKYLFTVHLHPISDTDARLARKKATTYMKNPNGKKLPPIEKEFDASKFNAWLIYLATTEEDQQNIWGNPAITQKYNLALPVDSIDVLLTLGEKHRLADVVTDISGLDDDEDSEESENMDEEEYAKN